MTSDNPVGYLDIPVVDINAENAVDTLLDAAKTYGFIFVKHENLDPSPSEVDSMFELSYDFFSSPLDIKKECSMNSTTSGSNHGWVSMNKETLDPKNQKKGDFKEAFNIGGFVDGKAQQPLPKSLKSHEEQIGKFIDHCHALCNKILRFLAIGLKISPSDGGANWFSARHDHSKGPSGSVFRLLYYPALPESRLHDPLKDIRPGAHSDYGSVTLLFRLPGQAGLQILTSSGQWAPVPVNPDSNSSSRALPILVNIGDLLSFWTNGLLKSTIHRVVFPTQGGRPNSVEDRYSMAYFCHPEDATELIEVPSDVIRAHSNAANSIVNGRDSVLTARDHLNRRLAATFS